MLTAIIGNMGTGKTATMSWLAKHFSKQNNSIYLNYSINDIRYRYVQTLKDLDSVKFGKAFYDEFWLWLDSRSSVLMK